MVDAFNNPTAKRRIKMKKFDANDFCEKIRTSLCTREDVHEVLKELTLTINCLGVHMNMRELDCDGNKNKLDNV
jgi:hypothetical protein